jgi:hypothetical protein
MITISSEKGQIKIEGAVNTMRYDADKVTYEVDGIIFRILYDGKKVLGRPLSRYDAMATMQDLINHFDTVKATALQQAAQNADRTIPIVTAISPSVFSVNQTVNVAFEGDNFSYDSQVEITGATVTNVQVLSPNKITADVAFPSTAGSLPLNVTNGKSSSNVWGIVAVDVVDIPAGASQLLQSSLSVNPNKYFGDVYARSVRSGRNPALAFDGNNNTFIERDSNDNNDGWFFGIIMSQPTLIERMAVSTRRGSTNLLLQGSNDTTNIADGTWTDIATYSTFYPIEQRISGIHIYRAFRFVYPNGAIASSARVGVREAFLTGKQ